MRLVVETRILIFAVAPLFLAADFQADPTTYSGIVPTLQRGDTLHLAAGSYSGGLAITGLNGTGESRITVTGPDAGAAAVFVGNACCNTVEITNSSFVTLRNLTLDARHIPGVFGISAKGGNTNRVHDIEVDGCTFLNHDGSQQTDAISTKTPTWGWYIHRNVILDAGTGLYLGNSTGDFPFVEGVIEDNFVWNPIGYCMEIKYQNPWPTDAGLPTTPGSTLIRNNVFIKGDGASPDGDRPNVLVGGFPNAGPGSLNRYEIYGNFFDHNPRESLLQVSGRVTVHDNIFVDAALKGVAAQDQNLPLKQVYIYNNTFYEVATGIGFANAASEDAGVVGNVIFSASPISGPVGDMRDNVTDVPANAGNYVAAPSLILGQMNFYPLAGQCQGAPLDLSKFSADIDWQVDFNGSSKNQITFRGAYAGQGTNPGWILNGGLKPGSVVANPDGGADGGIGDDAGIVVDAGVDAGGAVSGDGGTNPVVRAGCGCAGAASTPSAFTVVGIVLAIYCRRVRRADP